MKEKKQVVLGVTASVAIYRACDIVRRLMKEGFDVTVVMTEEAEKLISPLLFQSLSGNKVYRGMFEEPDTWQIEHISLAERANLVLIAPATANIIAKISAGICDDLLTCAVSATRAPVLICPAMNENMYKNKITQSNIKKLESLGYKFVEPKQGKLACGREGLGCLADAETIINEVKKAL